MNTDQFDIPYHVAFIIIYYYEYLYMYYLKISRILIKQVNHHWLRVTSYTTRSNIASQNIITENIEQMSLPANESTTQNFLLKIKLVPLFLKSDYNQVMNIHSYSQLFYSILYNVTTYCDMCFQKLLKHMQLQQNCFYQNGKFCNESLFYDGS